MTGQPRACAVQKQRAHAPGSRAQGAAVGPWVGQRRVLAQRKRKFATVLASMYHGSGGCRSPIDHAIEQVGFCPGGTHPAMLVQERFIPLDPDFERLRRVLMLEGEPDRVPNAELHVDWQVKQAFLGRPIADRAGRRGFLVPGRLRLYATCGPTMSTAWWATGTATRITSTAATCRSPNGAATRRAWSAVGTSTSAIPGPIPQTIDYTNLEACARIAVPRHEDHLWGRRHLYPGVAHHGL